VNAGFHAEQSHAARCAFTVVNGEFRGREEIRPGIATVHQARVRNHSKKVRFALKKVEKVARELWRTRCCVDRI
jgi:hypothetical protein